MKRTLVTAFAILVAAPALTPAIAQDMPLSVSLQPSVGCMVSGANPQIGASFTPADRVQAGRVYFKSALGDAFYYVEMTPTATGYMAVLPKPTPGAGPITYYVEGVTRNFVQGQSPEQLASVADSVAGCPQGLTPATSVAAAPLQVFSTSGTTALPAGFTGVSSVVVGSAGAGAAGAAGAAAAAGSAGGVAASVGASTAIGAGATSGAFLGGTTGIIAAAAVVVGVTTVVLVTTASGSR